MRLLCLTALAFSSVITLTAAPSITGVYNAASWLPPDLPNSGVAQGAIFTLRGTGLGPSTLLQVLNYPLPTTQGLGGTTVQVQVGGVTETCIMVYTWDVQVAAILPSATPVGAGTLTLSYQGATASYPIQVQTADFGTLTLNEGGTGPAVVTDNLYNPITMINPAFPGETLILWGSGLGAVPGNEAAGPPTQTDLGTGVQVLIGGQQATVSYGGRGSSAGLDQINFVVPPGVNGCKVSIAVTVNGVTGNVTTTSIAPAGQATCGDTFSGLTTANLQKAMNSGTLNLAGVELSRFEGGDDTLNADFAGFSLNNLIRSYGGTFAPSVGSCLAYEVEGSTLTYTDPIQPTYLDPGSPLVLTGPGGTKTIPQTSTGIFADALAIEPSTYIEPGKYTVANGSGGANVGSFNWSLTLPASVNPTIPSSINRSQNLTLTWTGGSAYPLVSIVLYNGVPVTSSLNSYVQILCTANASSGTFTVPSAFLSLLPAGGYGTPTEPGVSIQVAGVALNNFTVAGSPGLDEGFFDAYVYTGAVAKIQ